MSLRGALESLSTGRLAAVAALLAVVLSLPALGVGWQLDDHFQRLAMLRLTESDIEPGEIFTVLRGEEAPTRGFIEWGVLPWWTAPGFRLAFFRPLSVATTWLDYRLWPGSAPLMHLHSLLWAGLAAALAALVYRRLLGPDGRGRLAAALAALAFAVDEAHGVPAAWLANRNALLCAAFSFAALAAHHEWRQRGGAGWGLAAPVCLALGLASGEAALGAAGYLAAHALFLDHGGAARRIAGLAPAAGVFVAWAALYRWLGLGASGSGNYLDPLAAPVAFAAAVAERAPFFLLGLWTPLPADLGALLPAAAAAGLWGAAVLLLGAVGYGLWRGLAGAREAGFFAAGMLLACLPPCATFPSNRLLLVPGLGAMGLVGMFVAAGWKRGGGAPPPRGRRLLAVALVAAHFVAAPLFRPLAAWSVVPLGEPIVRAVDSLPDDPDLAGQTLVVVNSPDHLLFVTQIPTLRALDGLPLPRRMRALTAGPTALEIARPDERTLDVTAEGGLFRGPLGVLFRGRRLPLAAGQRVRLEEMEAIVGSPPAGPGARVRFRFDRPLEDPAYRWVRWDDGRFAPFSPPPVGGAVRLEAPRGPLDSFGPR